MLFGANSESTYGKVLSSLGATKGGYARADSLSKKARHDIAVKAAKTRWSQQASAPKQKTYKFTPPDASRQKDLSYNSLFS